MDKSYIKSDKKQAFLGDWFLFISILSVFFWFIYELYHTFNSEPSYRWETSFNMVGLSFGLINLDNEISQFEISDSSMKFYKANVSVETNSIFVSSPFVKNPIYARYAWSDTPNATLFNSDNFPASSFEIEVN